ncbi:AB-hydrolase YheT [Phellopilus nigrolimitatus]|nr:AB-hydrolase YheT [Phellopilus nigrolimitatus]
MGQSFSWLSPSPIPSLHTVETSLRLNVKTADRLERSESLSLHQFLQSRCPSLFAPFFPAWWLNSGHLQTFYCVFGDFSQIDKVVYDRTLIRLRDGGTLGLDSTPPARARVLSDDAPIVVVMHGLTGGSHESYVRAVLAQAVKPKEEGGLGYRGIVVNFRGCAGVPLTSGQLYSAGHTDDLRQALMYISQRYPKAPLLGLAFSLGANVIIRYLAEEGEHSRLRAGCTLGCPWDLVLNSSRIEENFFLRNVYSKGMGSNLTNLMKRNAPAILKLPENRITPLMPELYSLKSPTLLDFDSRITRNVGGSSPPFPFTTAWAYYEWASSHRCLGDVRVPLLAMNAADDPMVRHLPLDVGDNGRVALIVTAGGGHLGWFESVGGRCVRRWVTRPVIEWLRAVGEDLESGPSHILQITEVDGWTTEVGREGLGFKILGDEGEIKGIEGEGGLFAGL